MKIDCHVHLVGTSEKHGSYVAPRLLRSVAFRYLTWRHGLAGIDDPLERERLYLVRLANLVEASELDRAVLLAFDGVYTATGQLDKPRTGLMIANDSVAHACRKHPNQFLMGASVNPTRADAIDELERVARLGAVLVKLLPNSHGFDPANKRFRPYFRKLAELNLPALIHCGYEHTLPVIDQALGDPDRLRPVLEAGTTVIVAHVGSAGLFHLRETFGRFLQLLNRYPNCYGDISALTNLWRAKYLKQLLNPNTLQRKYGIDLPDVMSRMVHGSDFPIPITPLAFVERTSWRQRRSLNCGRNPLQCDIDLKRLLGVPDHCLTRAHDELGLGRHLDNGN